jgi:predicted GIY-YIG superfamily endonuclease
VQNQKQQQSRTVRPRCVGEDFAPDAGVNTDSRYVYVMVSTIDPARHYVGLTSNVTTRLAVHNSGGSQHTAQHRPWRVIVSLEFATQASAAAFEKYLKTGSGRAFAKRHFV